ncbi:DNA ligase [Accumulibacter sp.]|uniref:DNA ligase n=1 Tax=Accumulibacter sp. TaxID=2053492 RepID=UPI0025892C6D|nr:DNA ligase [Accumulibacter sp.]MCC2868108.1 DNA ligase [Candidatus Accumulibacter phosphatis]MCM8579314.1 DNA ligase [Accumulibacter sp.]HMW56797.1 DNA ligase [Accumulibacter sp.]
MRAHPIVQSLAWAALLGTALPLPAAETLPLLLAETEQGQADVALYLVSEKLDGVRAFWDGQALRTRNGHRIQVPSWFVARFPAQPLDGELWMGRGEFERLSGIVRRQTPDDSQWQQVRYLVFELPQSPGTFRQRALALRELTARLALPWLQAVEQWEFGSREALDKKLEQIVRAGGEGLMLHRADAAYVTGRSDVLLKLKAWHDAEATVIGHQPGRGKYAGMLGALRVRTAGGVEFMLGTGLSDADRRQPPPVGTLITFRYRELTARGLPRFASYHRPRDL